LILRGNVYVSNYSLTKISALEGARHDFDGLSLTEIVDQSLVMMAMPRNKTDKITKALNSSCGLSIPIIGQSGRSDDDSITLWRLQKDQLMVYFPYANDDADNYLKNKFKAPAYYTDQSDTWAMINVSGEESVNVLERICPLNLDLRTFTVGTVSRTVMEHIGTIIYREGRDSFVVLTMRSFGISMMHALEVSAKNVL
jgi:sarcosine oxidase subunit gamma